MKVQPMGVAAQAPQGPTPAQQARERAIAKLTGGQPTQSPVNNQNAVSPEEMGAIMPKSQGQSDTNVEVESQPEELEAQSTEQVEEVVEQAQPDPQLSKQYAALVRQEKQLRLKAQKLDQQVRAREQALQQREEALKAREQEYQTSYIPKSRLAQDPLSVLNEAGLSYDQLTEQFINQQSIPPQFQNHIRSLEAKLAKLEEANEKSAKGQIDAQAQQYQAAVNQIRADAKALVNSDPQFETIKAMGSVNEVVDLITETYNQEGVLLTVEEAATEVENYLMEEALKLTRIEKIKKKMSPQSQVVQPKANQAQTEQTPATQKQPQTMKTLTNANSGTRQLSARERALLAFKGELK